MSDGEKYYIAFIAASSLLFTYLHYSTTSEAHSLHDIYRELYYIPVVIGALVFGLRGAILSFLMVSLLQAPYIYIGWTGRPALEANKILHLFLQGFLGSLAGFLVDRERAQREQMNKDRYLAGLGQAAAVIVHDLKNPLITILGFTKRLEEGKGERETALRTIREAAMTMQSIVHDVLDLSKPISLQLTGEDVRDTIRRACESCRAKAQEEGVSLAVELTREALPIEIDALHLERALVNLINNAIDASGRGQNVTVKATPEKRHLTISIRDNGEGMDKETLENIFIPFYTKKSSGTGLGMPIAKKIVEGHKGKIYISSGPGEGTEMMIEIPWPEKRYP